MFRRVLIANRGEAALRVIRTCHELGVTSVLAHSEADAESLPALEADERVCIGPPPPLKSYLDIQAILGAATAWRCDGLHPGWGFLSESPELSRACSEAGVVFIGPRAETMQHMGDKIEARATARAAGVPVIPGSEGAVSGPQEAADIARETGYPVLLKAASGGGGRGIRLVESPEKMELEFAEASNEARNAFGDSRLYVEALLTGMRHVEVQVMGDGKGGAVHLYERDCSLQRRRQKLAEEAPAALVDESVRERMRAAAARLTAELEYTGAGTVEFLVKGREFHFMEMNARLQVEHTVTEMATGVDLVAAQLEAAANGRLLWRQEDIRLLGHAIECRINAEDPVRQIPSPGTVTRLELPGGPGVRVDTALFSGAEVPVWYDSLVAKVVVQHRTRSQALSRMRRALHELIIEGVQTNTMMHLRHLADDDFAKATV